MPDAVSGGINLMALRSWSKANPKMAELYASVEKMQEKIKALEAKGGEGKNEAKLLWQALSEIHNVTPYVVGIRIERAAGDTIDGAIQQHKRQA